VYTALCEHSGCTQHGVSTQSPWSLVCRSSCTLGRLQGSMRSASESAPPAAGRGRGSASP